VDAGGDQAAVRQGAGAVNSGAVRDDHNPAGRRLGAGQRRRRPAGHARASGPSATGSVVLDLGPGIGALVLHTPPGLDGRELDIAPRDPPSRAITHSLVRSRHTAAGVQYAAVYPDLRPGEYVIRLDGDGTELPVAIAAGQVTTARWPAR
jgi:hypothetical protein